MFRQRLIWMSLVAVPVCAVVFQNCSQHQFGAVADIASQTDLPSSTPMTSPPTEPPVGLPPINTGGPTVCGNLDGTGSCNGTGFAGNIYIQPRSSLVAGSHCGENIPVGATFVDSYIRNDWRAPYTVQLDELNVPARSFNEGFTLSNGQQLMVPTSSGAQEPLIEWFALDVEGAFHLASADDDGAYQFAIISDDGSRVSYMENGTTQWQDFIDDQKPLNIDTGNCLPGTQAAQMGCAATYGGKDIRTFALKKGDTLNLRVRYYQGPREGIALTFMYRKVPAAGPSDASCGQVLNFGVGGADHAALAQRGWKVISSANLSPSF